MPAKYLSSIKSNNSKIKAKKIEASGILWLPSLSRYLLISDEKYRDQPSVFMMDEDGIISSPLFPSSQENRLVDDLESISTDGHYIYMLSSLSHNSKDKLKKKRKRIIRFKYQNEQVTKLQKINLYRVLRSIKDTQKDTKLSIFLQHAFDDHSLDIESHFIENNNLYLGFKTPLTHNGESLIIKLTDVEALFSGETPFAEIWQTIRFNSIKQEEPMYLSDMISVNGQLLLLSVLDTDEKYSALWQYHPETQLLKNLQQFPDLQAEGITYRHDKAVLTIVFDDGKKRHSKYLNIPFLIE